MIVYLAGRMSGLPDKGRYSFSVWHSELNRQGYQVLNPALLPDGMPTEKYMPICLAMLDQAEAIALIPGWEDSKGANIERDYAKYQGKGIIYLPKERK